VIVSMLPAWYRNQSYIGWRFERVGMRVGWGWGWGWEINHYAQVKIITVLVIVEISTMLYQNLGHLTKIYNAGFNLDLCQ